jgi:2-haloacid dehalogenase
MPPLTARPSVLFFDVNETLLDLTPVKKQVNDVLRDEGGAALWFSTMLHHSLVMAVSDQYAEFTEVGTAALQMLGRSRDIAIHDNEAKEILGGMRRLKPHADVAPALVRLQRAGFRLAALTNSSQAGVGAQLAFAGLENYFERQISVDSVQRFKPHRDVYAWAAREMGAEPADCMLVAAHGWDVAGAQWAGMQSAFVAREGQQKFPLATQPDIEVTDFAALAEALGRAADSSGTP